MNLETIFNVERLSTIASQLGTIHFHEIYQIAIQNDYPTGACQDLYEKISEVVAQIFDLEKHIAYNQSSIKYNTFEEFEQDGGCLAINAAETDLEKKMQIIYDSDL